MEPEQTQAKIVTADAGVQLPAKLPAAPPTASTDTPIVTLPAPASSRVGAREARDTRDWTPDQEELKPLVSPYKIAIDVERGTVSFDDTTRPEFLAKLNLGKGKDKADAPPADFDAAVQALLTQPLTAEQFEKMIVDVQKFKTFQSLCSISRHWTSIQNRGNEPDNAPIIAEALDRRVGKKLYMNILFSERTIMGVPVSINTLLKSGYLKNEDFAGNDPRVDIIDQRVLKPFLEEVLIPADFLDMPSEYLPWIVHELKTRTEEAARNHPAVRTAAQTYIQDQLTDTAKNWMPTVRNSDNQ